MFSSFRPVRVRRAGLTLAAAGLALAGAPAASQAAVLLGTAAPFVVLGGSTVTNTGPSVLNGDLGVSPGSALVGFGLPAVVNGATHDNDAVAAAAQSSLTTAYNTAAAEPTPTDLTGLDLGGMNLTAGAYNFSTSAQLTGALTLDAAGDPNAQFVFQIGTTLTTASASSVLLINGASPCNVFWQVGSSATLGSTTAFQGNLMALASISLDNAATIRGRALARNGAVTLINNVIDGSVCGTSTTPPVTTPVPGGPTTTPALGTPAPGAPAPGTPAPGTTPGARPPASRATLATRKGTARIERTTDATPARDCVDGFTARIRGRLVKRVVFSMGGKQIAVRTKAPFQVHVAAGSHWRLTARVTFKDATRAKTVALAARACAAAVFSPRPGRARFTG